MEVTVRLDHGQVHQRIDGFGFCQAFRRAELLRGDGGMPAERCREVLDLLFDPERGAGMSILRLGIASSTTGADGLPLSIAPVDPGGPDRPLAYAWDGDDGGQVWLARQAARYGVRRFFANPWSAPGYMLDIGTDIGPGAIRGLPGTSPEQGDWRRTYAEYLLRYVRFYREAGIAITDLGFTNEPDLFLHEPDRVATYPAMRLDPAQVVDLVHVLGPAIERSGLPVSLVSCDAMSWEQQVRYTAAVEADPYASGRVDIHAGHNYHTPARQPLPTSRTTWMSEWDPDVDSHPGTWNGSWDSGRRCDGIRLAEDVHDALTMAGVSAYLYWFGVSTGGTRALIGFDGADYRVSHRLWAVAAFSRFVRPGARRIAADSDAGPAVKVSAFQNPGADTVLNILNLTTGGVAARLALDPPAAPDRLRRWLTDGSHRLEPAGSWAVGTPLALPARSLTTVLLPAYPTAPGH